MSLLYATSSLSDRRCCRGPTAAFALVILIGLGACNSEPKDDPNAYAHILPFDTATVRVASAKDTTRLTLELAESDEQKTLGLMERRSLAPNAGMLFLYSATQPATSAFWMFRTRIPLDIAYIDSAGIIRSIVNMQPCQSELAQGCPTYPSGYAYRAALEVNSGFFSQRGIRVGDRVFLADTTSRISRGARIR
jgi:hypothetical protein